VATIIAFVIAGWLGFNAGVAGFLLWKSAATRTSDGFIIAYLNSPSLLGLLLVFEAWLRSAFYMILKKLLDVGAERSPIFLGKLFKLGL
jgi:hypothetical protein